MTTPLTPNDQAGLVHATEVQGDVMPLYEGDNAPHFDTDPTKVVHGMAADEYDGFVPDSERPLIQAELLGLPTAYVAARKDMAYLDTGEGAASVGHVEGRPIPAGSLHRMQILGDRAVQAVKNDTRRQTQRTSGKNFKKSV